MAVQNNLVRNDLSNGMLAPSMDANAVTQSMVAKEQAKIQAQVFMAKQFPRKMDEVMNRITASCERPSLAQISEYEYPRGGQKITGASIRLLEVIAQCYGNISHSWKELTRDMTNHRSTCLAYAWDLETNLYSELEFEVYHYRSAKGQRILLTDDRDIYELVANQATRRVRRCLENVVPRDIVEDAREQCKVTMNTRVDWQSKIDNQIQYFNDTYGVRLSQIEEYFGMSRRGFTSNTFAALTRIYTSVRDGVSKIEDYFPKEEKKGVKNKLSKNETPTQNPTPNEEPTYQPHDENGEPTLL